MPDWILITITILSVLSFIVYYFTTNKRKRAYYRKEELRWKKISPSDMDMVRYSVFLVGDPGAPSLKHPDATLELLQSKLLTTKEKSGVIFLGDNIYPAGLPEPNHPDYDKAEKRLLTILHSLNGYKGDIKFISGNHDWKKGKKGGYETMRRQQLYIESYLNSREVYVPRNGCPGPYEVTVNNNLVIIYINSQWWVHNGIRPIGEKYGCTVESEHEFFLKLENTLSRHIDKNILVIGHHPMYSASHHGGHFSLKQHLFPFTSVHKNLYVPVPIAGSLFPIYRKYFGSNEDMAHPKYKNLRKRLLGIFSKYDNLIYAAGHDHNLQYIQKNKQHYLVSGSASKVHHVQKAEGAKFVHAHKGFMKLDFLYNGEVWLEVWEPFEGNKNGLLAYRKNIISSKIMNQE